MKYSMKCPVCGMPMETEAMNDEEAVTKFMGQAKEHMPSAHADMDMKTDEEMMEMIKGAMTHEAAAM